jgi:hypothetical protein
VDAVVQTLSEPQNQQAMGIQDIFAGPSLQLRYPNAANNDHVPDSIIKVNTGAIFTGGSKISEHGGMNEDDFHTALLVSNPSFSQKHVKTQVLNRQVAPTILRLWETTPSNSMLSGRKESRHCPSLATTTNKL